MINCARNYPKRKVLDGYRDCLWQKEQIDSVRTIRIWYYIIANEYFLNRILDYKNFMQTATFSGLFVRAVLVVIVNFPQFFIAYAVYLLSRFKHISFIFELYDIWSESIKALVAMKADSLAYRWPVNQSRFLNVRRCITFLNPKNAQQLVLSFLQIHDNLAICPDFRETVC